MFNKSDHTGFDILNHAIRIGTMDRVLRRNELLRQLNETKAILRNKPIFVPPVAVASACAETPPFFQFPWKLHDMLDNAKAGGFENLVSWYPDGK